MAQFTDSSPVLYHMALRFHVPRLAASPPDCVCLGPYTHQGQVRAFMLWSPAPHRDDQPFSVTCCIKRSIYSHSHLVCRYLAPGVWLTISADHTTHYKESFSLWHTQAICCHNAVSNYHCHLMPVRLLCEKARRNRVGENHGHHK